MKFRQPSHEFTFSVGMNFVSYPLVITPWYNKFVCACRFWSLVFMQNFSVESKTSGLSSLSTLWQDLEVWYKLSNEVNMTPRSLRTKPEKMENSEDPVRKMSNLAGQGASSKPQRNWRQGPTCSWGNTLEDLGSNTATPGKGGRGLGRSGPRPTAHFEAQSPPPPLWSSRHSDYL
jgi:hypothetical protein